MNFLSAYIKWACLVVIALGVGSAFSATEMPSWDGMLQGEGEVARALTDVRQEFMSNKLSHRDVAQFALSKAETCHNVAQKILLYKGAVVLFSQGGDFHSAEKAFVAMTNSVVMPIQIQAKILDQALRNVSSTNADRMAILLDRSISLMCVDDLQKKLKMDPENVLLHRRIGEQYVILGDWGLALEHFTHSGGEYAHMAAMELSGTGSWKIWKDLGDFWWLESDDRADLLHEGYRIHARTLYGRSMRRHEAEQFDKK